VDGPLSGVRILDMTSVIMGPYATQILADFGADVIKIESPLGDTTRQVPPFRTKGMGAFYLHINRNKRSVVLDLKRPEALAALMRLVETADVLAYNVRPQAMARLGLGHDRLVEVNPRIISVGMVGFGQDGPYAADPAYEDLIQGLTAIPSMLVDAGSDHPHYVPLSFNDRAVGLNAAVALTAALFHRERTGRGQEIIVPMFETMVQAVYSDHMGGLTFDPALGPPGYKRQLNKDRRPYPTRDGYVCVIVYTDIHWRTFCDIIGRPTLMEDDPRFANITTRTEHAEAVYAFIGEEMKRRTSGEWLEVLKAGDIPAAPMHTLDSLLDDPHLRATNFIRTVDHPTEGRIRQMEVPSRWSDSPPSLRRPAPRLGEHTVEILREAGLSEPEVEAILAGKAAVQAEPREQEA
jgi:crotonobetainyl-CoA:carnitine CoA-transferase CaiB-like acyl-CoA transferase